MCAEQGGRGTAPGKQLASAAVLLRREDDLVNSLLSRSPLVQPERRDGQGPGTGPWPHRAQSEGSGQQSSENHWAFAASFPPIPALDGQSMEPFQAGTGALLSSPTCSHGSSSFPQPPKTGEIYPRMPSACPGMWPCSGTAGAELDQSLRLSPELSRTGLGVSGGVRSIQLMFPQFP